MWVKFEHKRKEKKRNCEWITKAVTGVSLWVEMSWTGSSLLISQTRMIPTFPDANWTNCKKKSRVTLTMEMKIQFGKENWICIEWVRDRVWPSIDFVVANRSQRQDLQYDEWEWLLRVHSTLWEAERSQVRRSHSTLAWLHHLEQIKQSTKKSII